MDHATNVNYKDRSREIKKGKGLKKFTEKLKHEKYIIENLK